MNDIAQTPGNNAKQLVQNVSGQLKKMGHPAVVTPASMNPPQSLISVINEVGGEIVHSAGEDFKESLEGKESATHDRITDSKPAVKEVMGRVLKKVT